MNTLDIIIAALMLYGAIRGLMKGLFVELASLASLVLGVYGAIHFSNFTANILKEYVQWEEQYISIGAFAITFVIIVVVIALIGKIFTKIADFAALGILNKILGGVFGALKIGLILSIVLLVFDKLNTTFSLGENVKTEDSILYQPVKSIAPMLFSDFLSGEEINFTEKVTQE